MNDGFSKCHPAVNFLFFAGAILAGVLIQHPAYLTAGLIIGAVYYLLLNGKKGIGTLLGLLPLFLFLTVVNPLFNTNGATPLFFLFGRPYTLEALLYGVVVAGMFVSMLLWFGCYNKVLTSDKFTALFGNLIPSLSLLLVMVFRLVPNFLRKAGQIGAARKSIGRGGGRTPKEALAEGMAILGALTSWALEGGVVTGDSMRARGYGAAKRSNFGRHAMTAADGLLLGLMGLSMGLTVAACLQGQGAVVFTPDFSVAPVSWGVVSYMGYLFIPVALHIKEAIQWHISKSRI